MEAFYQQQTVLLMGSTGFVGKFILFQLLRMKTRKVYLLIRKKKNKTAQQRFEDLFSDFLFTSDLLRLKKRVQLVEGDVSTASHGIKLHDLSLLRNEVTIVIHSATSTRFDHSLSAAVRRNLLSTSVMLKLCNTIVGLRCLVYVSTSYTGCYRRFIEERVATSDCKKAMDLLQLLESDPAFLDSSELNGHPNTFTFSKFHAESLVHYSGVPHAIVRHPIVIGSLRDPTRAWLDNFHNFHGVVAQADMGYEIPILLDPVSQITLIPVDMAANIVIGAGWRCAERHRANGLVYNCIDTCTTPLAKEMTTRMITALENRPTKPANYRKLNTTNSRVWRFIVLVLFYIPAFITDMWTVLITRHICSGQRNIEAVTKLRRAHLKASVLDNFPSGDFIFDYENVRSLTTLLPPKEYKKYPMDVSYIDWDTFMRDIALSVASYVQTYKHDEETS
ncbi:fatty acyl-CoA reductase wat-like isoform X2 [Varroa jacobsoni]|uniref:Fatty acyl-CoA reductase n=1 Tax=Varroa destructor TaxID=109461 RepID=A0A7M7KZK2_VARDE|nr:fatty acyl-CoA reductase wat-like [Varroa destructor]XP_022673264.1 fatty acyl-CoA reductase wat-like [Varroa destructor]XP_022704789.1 fatty acyl-CoA reductase wat-like isoform X2 [Varroa jacobsoni]